MIARAFKVHNDRDRGSTPVPRRVRAGGGLKVRPVGEKAERGE